MDALKDKKEHEGAKKASDEDASKRHDARIDATFETIKLMRKEADLEGQGNKKKMPAFKTLDVPDHKADDMPEPKPQQKA